MSPPELKKPSPADSQKKTRTSIRSTFGIAYQVEMIVTTRAVRVPAQEVKPEDLAAMRAPEQLM